MDHLGYGGWKTGLQGDQGVAGGYTMDPGYPLLAPSAPLLDTTSSHPYVHAPRWDIVYIFRFLLFNSLFTESWWLRAATVWAPRWPGWGRVTTNTTSPSTRRSEKREETPILSRGGHCTAADFFIKFLDSVPSVCRDKSHHSHLLRRLRRFSTAVQHFMNTLWSNKVSLVDTSSRLNWI